VRETLTYDAKTMPAEELATLRVLERELRPVDLVRQVRAIVFAVRTDDVDLDDFDEHASDDAMSRIARADALAKRLGKATAAQPDVFEELLPDLVTNSCPKLWLFGQGLVEGNADPDWVWERLVAGLNGADERVRNAQVLRGFLHALHQRDPARAGVHLDQSVDDDALGVWYPALQVAIGIDDDGVARLKRSLDLGKAPAGMYQFLAYDCGGIPAAALQDLLVRIAAMPSGLEIAFDVLYMPLHAEQKQTGPVAPELTAIGVALLQQMPFANKNGREDYQVGSVVKHCLAGEDGAAVVNELCGRFRAAVAGDETYAFYHDDFIDALFEAQPVAALEGICGGDAKALAAGVQILREVANRKHPLGHVSDEELLAWCDQKPDVRYPAIAELLVISEQSESTPPRWTTTALCFLERAPDAAAVLRSFVRQFVPSSGWKGSLAAMIEVNATLLDQLDAYPVLRPSVAAEKVRVQAWIARERSEEATHDRARDERFE
jgi:hypothetical protein